ncbi:MAG: hypothetical protein Fues2KO_00220 [Fuerstiella sp.]
MALLIGCIVTAAQRLQRGGGVGAVDLTLWIIFTVIGGVGLIFAVLWKNLSSTELHNESQRQFDETQFADIPMDTGYCFQQGQRAAAVLIDHAAGRIYFQNCHIPNRFLARPDPLFSCTLSELQAVYAYRYRGAYLIVITPAGHALVRDMESGFQQLKDQLMSIEAGSASGSAAYHPLTGIIYPICCVAGIAGAVFLTPQNAGDGLLTAATIFGGCIGMAGGSAALNWIRTKSKS